MVARVRVAALVVWLGATGVCFGADDVVVCWYNLANYLPTDRVVKGKSVAMAPKPEEEIAALVGVIASIRPDILSVCEMGDEGMLADLQGRLRAAGVDLPHSEWVRGADAHRHLALLSRFPIVARASRDHVPFDLNGRPQRVQRGIMDVTIALAPEYNLRLVGVHLKSRREDPEIDQAWLRAKEAWYVRQHLLEILKEDPEANVMLVGDFNDTKNEYPVRELIGTRGSPTYFFDIWLTDSRGERWTHYWRTADVYSRIDYILLSPGLVPEVDLKKCGIHDGEGWAVASDHRAIFATVRAEEKR